VKEVTSSYQAGAIEESVQQYWRTRRTYEQVKELHKNDPPYFFVDGPPYTTGHIHLGTAWNKIIKDSILRYKRMRGNHVIARAGYDMHGLPIEVRVEQQLGFASKKDIETYGIGAFIDECRRFAAANKDVMSEQFQRLGVWLDFDDPYQTMQPEYIEAAWWTIRQAADRGMLERGYRVVNWCPRCATAIADAEVEYWDERDPSIFVKFPIDGQDNEYLVIWTTTPWTLPANVAVAVHPSISYARVRAIKDGKVDFLWIAEPLVEAVLRKARYQDYVILDKKPGTDLVDFVYHSPLRHRIPLQEEIEHRVVTADFVTLENTGMVHIAPGHGWDDYLLGCRENLPIVCPVDASGCFTEEGGFLSCMYVRDANRPVLDELAGHLMAEETVVHRYGHCWRCKTPIIFRATEQWFLKVSEIRDRMLEEVEDVSWYPDWAGSARFHDWIKEARDWCISRQRYWGIPIPIWQCPSCSESRIIGTIQELEDLSGQKVPDPHRPYVDLIEIPCTCGSRMHRVEDIFDVWFDSAVASWATLRFPGETAEFSALWPADFITEGQDQTRGWFYSQLGASTIAFNRAPYRRVLMHGFVLDAEGRKMSKSLGNVVSPEEVCTQAGVDVLRLYVLSQSAPWDDLKFNWEGVRTTSRAINIFWNVYRFPLPYMILDGFSPASHDEQWDGGYVREHAGSMPPEDRWILSRVNSLAGLVAGAMDECQLHRATRALISFILEDLSRWYVQLVRPRMWLEGESLQKRFAYETMYYTMRSLVQVLAPFIPHITEEMYRNLRLSGDPESVHMLPAKAADVSLVDRSLESAMDVVRAFDDAQANARQAGKRKLRWPVGQCVVVSGSPEIREALSLLNAICTERANAREVRVIEGTWDRIGWRAEPLMKALGPAFGRDAPHVRELILAADASRLKQALDAGQPVTLAGTGNTYEILPGQVTFHEDLPGTIFSAPMEGATVYVDVELTPDLEAEGYARELIRRLQEMRRLLDLNVEDFILVDAAIADDRIGCLLRERWITGIGEEVRARELRLHGPGGLPGHAKSRELVKEWDIEGIAVTLALSRAPDQ
jgi:isoleucyl-tRNA synthetase